MSYWQFYFYSVYNKEQLSTPEVSIYTVYFWTWYQKDQVLHCPNSLCRLHTIIGIELSLAHILESWPKCINNTFCRDIKMQSFVTAVAVILIGSLQLAAPMVSFIYTSAMYSIYPQFKYVIWEELKVHQLHGSYCHIRSYEGFSSHSHSPNPQIPTYRYFADLELPMRNCWKYP